LSVAPDSDVAEADDLVLTLADGDVLDPDVVVSAVAADVVVVREPVVVVAAGGAAVVGDTPAERMATLLDTNI
jgi:hypothetical protein